LRIGKEKKLESERYLVGHKIPLQRGYQVKEKKITSEKGDVTPGVRKTLLRQHTKKSTNTCTKRWKRETLGWLGGVRVKHGGLLGWGGGQKKV